MWNRFCAGGKKVLGHMHCGIWHIPGIAATINNGLSWLFFAVRRGKDLVLFILEQCRSKHGRDILMHISLLIVQSAWTLEIVGCTLSRNIMACAILMLFLLFLFGQSHSSAFWYTHEAGLHNLCIWISVGLGRDLATHCFICMVAISMYMAHTACNSWQLLTFDRYKFLHGTMKAK